MRESLHESELKDILDALNDLKKDGFGGSFGTKKTDRLTQSSISRASRDLIMSFPVLCEDTIDPKTASMICKAIERKCVSMMQILFSAANMKASDGISLLQKWHRNVSGDFNFLDNYMDAMDAFSDGRLNVFESYKEQIATRNMIFEATKEIQKENQKPGKCYQESFSDKSLLGYAVYKDRFDDKPVVMAVREAEKSVVNTNTTSKVDNSVKNNQKYTTNNNQRYTTNNTYKTEDPMRASTEFFTKQLMDSDVKKANELQPSLMIVRFLVDDPDSTTTIERQFVAGVKARLIPVDSYDLFDRIESKNKDNNGLVQLVRATTKEISFVKDYLLAIDRAKMDAIKVSRSKTSGIFKTLERRATKSVWNRLIGKGNDAGCITTMVLSKTGVDFMKKEYNINLMDPRIASTIMGSYNLLCFVVVDESIDVAYFLFDGDGSYEQVSFNSLERESGDGSYKKVINLLSKINR